MSSDLTILEKKIFKNAPIGIYTVERDGTISFWNDKMAEISGSSAEVVLGKNVFSLPTYKKVGLDSFIRRILKGETIEISSLHYVSYFAKKESYRHYLGQPIYEKNGKTVARALMMVQDVTEREKLKIELKKSAEDLKVKVRERTRKLREKLEKIEQLNDSLRKAKLATLNVLEDLDEEKKKVEEKVKKRTKELRQEKDKIETVLQSIGDGVFVIDRNFRIVMFNQVAADVSGFATKEVLGKKYDKVLRFVLEKDEKVNDKFIREAMASGEIKKMSNHTILIRKDGMKVPVADSAAPIKDRDGRVIGSVIVFRDVTKEREIDRAKSEFVSLASHQLRTPLSTVKWYVEMLLSEDLGRLDERQKKYLEKIYHNNQRMVTLVGTLLNVSRIELGTLAMEMKPTGLKKITDDLLDEFLPQIKDKHLKVEKKYDKSLPIIKSDPRFVRMIIQNLLSNAVKYNIEKGKVSVEIKKGDRHIFIKVADTGLGIPKSQQSKISTKLFRADNARKHDTDGTGLGLYITKAVVEKLGGKIWFESEKDKGTTFYVKLPIGRK